MKPSRMVGVVVAAIALAAGGVGVHVHTAHAQAAAINVAGPWTSQFAGAAANLSLTQSGPNVIGIYVNSPPLLPGAMAGVMQGNVLTGRWTDARTSGGFAITFSPDGRTFTGTWGRTVASIDSGGPWVGHRP